MPHRTMASSADSITMLVNRIRRMICRLIAASTGNSCNGSWIAPHAGGCITCRWSRKRKETMNSMRLTWIGVLVLAFAGTGCETTRKGYYNAWEKFGYAKRERLVDNVKEARQEQVEAKQQFANALEQFKSVVNFQGGDLENVYNKLNKEYQRSETQATAVRDKITGVKRVASALFTEWKGEISEIKGDPTLSSKSQELYDRTKDNYDELIQRM